MSSLFDDAVFDVETSPSKATTTDAPTENRQQATSAPTGTSTTASPTMTAFTLAPTDTVAPVQGNAATTQVLEGDDGYLTSLRYLDQLRSDASKISRRENSNVDLVTMPGTNETIAICHISFISSFTYGDYVPQLDGLEDTYAIALALQHLNTGDGSIVPEVQGLNERCKIRFTAEFTDDQGKGGNSLRSVVDQTGRKLPEQLPCAVIGNSLSSITIPTSIVTGFLGYPQVSAYATSVDLDDRSQYPLFGRTIPSDQGNAIPIVLFLHDILKLKHLAVINVNDAYGNAFVGSLREAAAAHAPGLQIRQFPLNDDSQESIEQVIESIKETEYRFIFCIVFTSETNDALLLEAYKNDMAGNGKFNWVFGDSFSGYLDGRTFKKGSPLSLAYQGVGLVEASGGLSGMPGFDKFVSEMRKFKNPVDLDYIGALLPKHDHPSYPPTYKEHPFMFSDDFLNPVVNTYSPFHYEAAIALGLAACSAADSMDSLAITGRQQYKAFKNTSFTGIGGSVAFDLVSGTRLPTRALYRVTNWVEEERDNSKVAFKPVISTLFIDGNWEQRSKYVFNDGTTMIPLDIAPPPQEANLGLAVALPLVMALILGMSVFYWIENKRRRNDTVWKVDRSELKFYDPPKIIGRGTFGTVLLAEYRGTQVAVKHVIPRRKGDRTSSSAGNTTDHSRSTDNDASDMGDEEMGNPGAGKTSWGGASLSQATMSTAISRFRSGPTTGPMSTFTGKGRESEYAQRRRLRLEFMEEMSYLSKLRHPCITTVMGAVIDKEEPMMIMEYMDHGSLYDLLHNETVALEGEMLLNFLKDITQGIRFLHSAKPQVIHGDLKAANILVDNRFRAKVADFGLSQKKNLGGTGTPFWMAPELLRKESMNTAATDVYSFGIILYEAYSRRDPYEGEDARAVLKGVMSQTILKRPTAPRNMCDQVKQLMADCLEDVPMLRPTFEELDTRLKRVNAEKMDLGESKPKGAVSLFDIFPRHIAEALRDGRPVEAEHRDIVTIFFSDIVGFTDISSTMEPRKVASMLDRLYTKFDRLSHRHEIFKLETIGDAYVAVTNLVKDQPDDHAKRIAQFAIDAIDAANETLVDVDDPSKGNVNIRVGFHCGPVVADVVGTRNPRYCLFGDSVNTASRMESNSKVNRIHCSDVAATILREQCPDLPLRSRGRIQIKGKGDMHTWWVNEGAGQRRMSQDGSQAHVIARAIRGLQAVREDLSADFKAEKRAAKISTHEQALPEQPQSQQEVMRMPKDSAGIHKPEYLIESAPEQVPALSNKTRVMTFVAPPGKLGIILDTTTGSPKVYQVHKLSAVGSHVAIGDVICEIDGIDTRRMSHTEISALMLANAGHARTFTIERKVS